MVLRPERCVVWDGHPCSECTKDIELEKEIKKLEHFIEKIHIERRALYTVMNENHDHLSRELPPEIVSQIFIQYSPTNAFFDKCVTTRSHPLYLGAVCQKWRQLAWATPELWTSLHIELRLNRNHEALPRLVNEWLERSGTLPLTIEFVAGSGRIPGDEVYPEVINILNDHSARWRDVHFRLPPPHLNRLCGSFPGNILRRLVLSGPTHSYWDLPDASDLTSSMKSKPCPTHLTLRAFSIISVDVFWNFITVASLNMIGADECTEFLRRCPLLESLVLSRINLSSGAFPCSKTRIHCLHLRSFELSKIFHELMVTEILNSMCLPALERWTQWYTPFVLDSMISLARCSSFCLKEFKISGGADAYENVHNLLHHLSSLEVLQLEFWVFHQCRPPGRGNELLRLLCAPRVGMGKSSLFLPYLQ